MGGANACCAQRESDGSCAKEKRPKLIPASEENTSVPGHRIQTPQGWIVYPAGVYAVQVDCRCLSDTMKEPGSCCVAEPVAQFMKARGASELLDSYLLKLASCPTMSVFTRDRCALLQAQEAFQPRFAEKGIRLDLCELQGNEPPTPTASQKVIVVKPQHNPEKGFPPAEVGGALQWALFVAADVENFEAEHRMEDLDVASPTIRKSATNFFPSAENATTPRSMDEDGVL